MPETTRAAVLRESPGAQVRLRQVLDGHLAVVRNGLAWLGAAEPMRAAALGSVQTAVSPEAAERLTRLGLEQLHTVATVEQIRAVRDELDHRLRRLGRQVLLRFAQLVPPQDRRLYVSDHLGVRIMPPRATMRGRAEELRDYTGFLVPTQAHRDSWFNTAVNSVNLWIALSRVRPDNGLMIWPEAYGRQVRHEGIRLLPDQPIGFAVEVALSPGDLLLFAGDQLHATRPNTGPETRWVVTKRICLGPPCYNPDATGWVPYLDPRFLDTPLRSLAPLRSSLTTGRARQLARDTGQWLSRFRYGRY